MMTTDKDLEDLLRQVRLSTTAEQDERILADALAAIGQSGVEHQSKPLPTKPLPTATANAVASTGQPAVFPLRTVARSLRRHWRVSTAACVLVLLAALPFALTRTEVADSGEADEVAVLTKSPENPDRPTFGTEGGNTTHKVAEAAHVQPPKTPSRETVALGGRRTLHRSVGSVGPPKTVAGGTRPANRERSTTPSAQTLAIQARNFTAAVAPGDGNKTFRTRAAAVRNKDFGLQAKREASGSASGLPGVLDAKKTVAKSPLIYKLRLTQVLEDLQGKVFSHKDTAKREILLEAEVLRVFKGDPKTAGQRVVLVWDTRVGGVPRWDSCLHAEQVLPEHAGSAEAFYLMALTPAEPATDAEGRPRLKTVFPPDIRGTRVSKADVDPKKWATAKNTLERLKLELLSALDDPDADTRHSAIKGLRRWGDHLFSGGPLWKDERAAARILAASRDPDWRVRWVVAWIIPKETGEEGEKALVRLLSDTHQDVRQVAANVLRRRGQEEPAKTLLDEPPTETAPIRSTIPEPPAGKRRRLDEQKKAIPTTQRGEEAAGARRADQTPGAEAAWGEAAGGLQCRLLMLTPTVKPHRPSWKDQHVFVVYELRNLSDKPIRLLPSSTPIWRLGPSDFRVQRPDGKTAQYVGVHRSPAPFGPEKFLAIGPGQTLRERVGLPYDFSSPGVYSVSTSKRAGKGELRWFYGEHAGKLKENPDRVWTGTLTSNTVTLSVEAASGKEQPTRDKKANAPTKAEKPARPCCAGGGRVVDAETGEPIEHFAYQEGWPDSRYPAGIMWASTQYCEEGKRGGWFNISHSCARGGKVRVRILADGYLPEVAVVETNKEGLLDAHLVVRLRRGKGIRGRVLDHQAKPVEGATIFLRGGGPFRILNGRIKHLGGQRTTTDADGRFVATGGGEHVTHILVLAPHLNIWSVPAPRNLGEREDSGAEGLTIKLPQPATLKVVFDIPGAVDRGEVHDKEPGGLLVPAGGNAQFKLKLIKMDGEGWKGAGDTRQWETVANPGEVLIDNLAPGVYDFYRKINLGIRGHGIRTRFYGRREIALKPGETQVVRFVRDKGQRVSGEIRSLPEGSSDVLVTVSPVGDSGKTGKREPGDWVSCKRNGRFVTPLLAPGEYRIGATAYAPPKPRGDASSKPISISGIARIPTADYIGTAHATIKESGPPVEVRIVMKRPSSAGREATSMIEAENRDRR